MVNRNPPKWPKPSAFGDSGYVTSRTPRPRSSPARSWWSSRSTKPTRTSGSPCRAQRPSLVPCSWERPFQNRAKSQRHKHHRYDPLAGAVPKLVDVKLTNRHYRIKVPDCEQDLQPLQPLSQLSNMGKGHIAGASLQHPTRSSSHCKA